MAADEPREEMDDAPPFGTWRIIYFVVLGALAAEIVLGIAVTFAFRNLR